eukprot:m.246528 g.246528  ORF g.246528 m.246528 type:complete len:208 (-) comp19065_c0_seq18:2366-2989(-)
MLLHLLTDINAKAIVLASGSPRRKELLTTLGLNFSVLPSEFDERSLVKSDFATPSDFVQESAKQKATEVAKRDGATGDLFIGADTVVVLGGKILEKPLTDANAKEMLSALSGQSHYVVTGVALLTADGTPLRIFHEKTDVMFAELSEKEIDAYVATGEPRDKAGSYGIQGQGGAFVSSIQGDYANVVGFPVHRFCRELADLSVAGLL